MYFEKPAGRERNHGEKLERRRVVFDVVELFQHCMVSPSNDFCDCATKGD